jgi:cytochrome c556
VDRHLWPLPEATGAAAVTLGYLTPESAVARMKVSGTAPNYTGLYACVANSTVAPSARLDQASAEFPEIYKTSGVVDIMVEIDEVFDNLKAVEKAAWMAPSHHPDLVPSAEAGRLENLLRNLNDDPEVKSKSAEFHEWLTQSAIHAKALEDELNSASKSPTALAATFKLIAQDCKTCHAKYRD